MLTVSNCPVLGQPLESNNVIDNGAPTRKQPDHPISRSGHRQPIGRWTLKYVY